MGRTEETRRAKRGSRGSASERIADVGQTEPSGLVCQLRALTTRLNSLNTAQLSSEEVAAIEELLEQLTPHLCGKQRSR
jgi:hypothetical protein